MKKEYWDVTDEQVIEKTGKKIAEWITILDNFKAGEKKSFSENAPAVVEKSNDVVAFLQKDYEVPRYWARTLTTLYLKKDDV